MYDGVKLSEVELRDVAPPNLAHDASCAAMLGAISAACRELAEKIRRLAFLATIEEQPSEIVDELAWQYHVDFYDATLPLDTRRQLVRRHNEWHRIKGTPAAIERLMESTFGDGRVVEWFERPGMEPYTFEVHTTNAAVEDAEVRRFRAAVSAAKNVRSHLTAVVVEATSEAETQIYTAAAGMIFEKIRATAE